MSKCYWYQTIAFVAVGHRTTPHSIYMRALVIRDSYCLITHPLSTSTAFRMMSAIPESGSNASAPLKHAALCGHAALSTF